MTTAKAGLEDVVAANSAICEIIGSEGKLTYRGIDIHELARHSSFEETTYLLWFGSLPAEASLRQFSADLAARRRLPQEVIGLIERFPRHSRPMDVLRTAVSALPLFAPPVPPGPEADVERAMRVTAQMATIVAAYEQVRRGRKPVEPAREGSQAESFLRMLFAAEPDRLAVRAMDLALTLH